MAEIICLASSKGGSGKTTITASLGAFLAQTGRKVLLIDCDEGTHGLTLMFLDEVNSNRKRSNITLLGTFDLIDSAENDRLEKSKVRIGENLSLLPARHVFSDVDISPVGPGFLSQLNLLINHYRNDFDFILLDAQAGISLASQAAMSPNNSDIVILVSEYDPMSNAGIERLKARLPDELDVSRTWILLNKLLPEFVSKFSEFLSVARYLPPIPWTADVVRAYSRRRLALDFNDGNQFTLAILAVLRELLDRDDQSLLEDWIEKQTQRLRAPIQEQLVDAERVLQQMQIATSAALEERPNISMILLTRLSATFSIFAAVMVTFVGFTGDTFSPKLLEFALDNRNISVAFGVVGLAVLTSYVLEAFRRAMKEEREKSKRVAAQHIGELAELERRVNDLKALRSAGFEAIISQQERQRRP